MFAKRPKAQVRRANASLSCRLLNGVVNGHGNRSEVLYCVGLCLQRNSDLGDGSSRCRVCAGGQGPGSAPIFRHGGWFVILLLLHSLPRSVGRDDTLKGRSEDAAGKEIKSDCPLLRNGLPLSVQPINLPMIVPDGTTVADNVLSLSLCLPTLQPKSPPLRSTVQVSRRAD
ncbi:hypothetical protein LZ32DRAFT_130475 [Colletotrichum eremochloae]|nr:hypothetical protein LZ32DRAFT_130475 [Colletotrichum eremochloae]